MVIALIILWVKLLWSIMLDYLVGGNAWNVSLSNSGIRVRTLSFHWLGRGALLPKAGDGIEVALPVPHLTLALRQPVEFIHVAVGWGPQVGAIAALKKLTLITVPIHHPKYLRGSVLGKEHLEPVHGYVRVDGLCGHIVASAIGTSHILGLLSVQAVRLLYKLRLNSMLLFNLKISLLTGPDSPVEGRASLTANRRATSKP